LAKAGRTVGRCKKQFVNCGTMAQGKSILVIGRHEGLLAKVMALLTAHGYQTKGALTDTDAVATFSRHYFDAVVIGGGVEAGSRQLFLERFKQQAPTVAIIDAHPGSVLQDLQRVLGS
jgi:DNA-binding NtrC family response regulator